MSFFQKIKNFFKSIFGTKEKALTAGSENVQEQPVKPREKANSIEIMKRKQKIVALQSKYEEGYIKEKDLTENEKKELINLYKEQINTLGANIEKQREDMEVYKAKIIKMTKQVSNA